jgi:hypothetical protein
MKFKNQIFFLQLLSFSVLFSWTSSLTPKFVEFIKPWATYSATNGRNAIVSKYGVDYGDLYSPVQPDGFISDMTKISKANTLVQWYRYQYELQKGSSKRIYPEIKKVCYPAILPNAPDRKPVFLCQYTAPSDKTVDKPPDKQKFINCLYLFEIYDSKIESGNWVIDFDKQLFSVDDPNDPNILRYKKPFPKMNFRDIRYQDTIDCLKSKDPEIQRKMVDKLALFFVEPQRFPKILEEIANRYSPSFLQIIKIVQFGKRTIGKIKFISKSKLIKLNEKNAQCLNNILIKSIP